MATSERGLHHKKQQILIADDITAMRTLLKELLMPFGEEILEAEDGLQAKDMIFEYQPQIVLIDWKMPLLDGVEVTKAVRQNTEIKQPKIIMISARSDENRDEAFNAGVDDFINKPLQFDNLHNVIEQYIC